MATHFELRRTSRSGPLVPARCAEALAKLARCDAPRGAMRGQELRLALRLALDDAAAAAFLLDFPAQGARVEATGRGPSEALLAWAFHVLASALDSELLVGGHAVPPDPRAHHPAAVAYLDAYEADVSATRTADESIDGDAFVAWLAREEHVAVADGADFSDLELDDPARVYEHLLESDGIDEVFIGERELGRLLTRFRARAVV